MECFRQEFCSERPREDFSGLRVLVIGAGVQGLCNALNMALSGARVAVLAERLTSIASRTAAAYWFPFATEDSRAPLWSQQTHGFLARLIRASCTNSRLLNLCQWAEALELRTGTPTPFQETPLIPHCFPGVGALPASQLQPPFTHGFRYDGILAQSDAIMDTMVACLKECGVPIVRKRFDSKDQISEYAATHGYNCVINCCGLGARDMLQDYSVYASRGQLVVLGEEALQITKGRVFAPPPDELQFAYIISRQKDVVLGGTTWLHDYTTDAIPQVSREILKRCDALCPGLARAVADGRVPVLHEKVCLRPMRPQVCLSKRHVDPRLLWVDNYGHGGAGWTMFFGCMLSVQELVRENLKGIQSNSKL